MSSKPDELVSVPPSLPSQLATLHPTWMNTFLFLVCYKFASSCSCSLPLMHCFFSFYTVALGCLCSYVLYFCGIKYGKIRIAFHSLTANAIFPVLALMRMSLSTWNIVLVLFHFAAYAPFCLLMPSCHLYFTFQSNSLYLLRGLFLHSQSLLRPYAFLYP